MEMLIRLGVNFGRSSSGETMDWERPEWIGRNLINLGVVDPQSKATRHNLGGSKPRSRAFSRDFLKREHTKLKKRNIVPKPAKAPTSFCQKPVAKTCDGCEYNQLDCQLR
jgi:hypothetical protein